MESLRKQDILVYGAGNFFLRNKELLQKQYNIEAIIDKNKEGVLENWEIIKIRECSNFAYRYIIIMVENIGDCFSIIRDLMDIGIESDKIIYGGGVYGIYADKYDEIKVLSDGKLCVSKNGIKISVSSEDEFNNVYATLVTECYRYKINNNRTDVVIDVGMNVGDATLYFLADKKVKKVYAYEPFEKTFIDAQRNLGNHLNDSNRLEIFQYGLSDKSEERQIVYNEDMTCGLSTKTTEELEGYNIYDFYYTNGYAEQQKEKMETIQVKNAADVLLPIIEKYKPGNNIILKLNCEGEEYGIIEILSKENVLSQIDFIMLSWHYRGKERLLDELSKAGFSYLCTGQKENAGQLCAWKNGM